MEERQRKFLTVLAASGLVIGWIAVPLYMQTLGYSAIQVSLAVIVVYYIGFKLWKKYSEE